MQEMGFAWSAVLAALVFILPLVISYLKKRIPQLDGPAAYWVTLVTQILVGVLAWATDGNPMLIGEGAIAGFASIGVYEGARRTGLAKGSKARGER